MLALRNQTLSIAPASAYFPIGLVSLHNRAHLAHKELMHFAALSAEQVVVHILVVVLGLHGILCAVDVSDDENVHSATGA